MPDNEQFFFRWADDEVCNSDTFLRDAEEINLLIQRFESKYKGKNILILYVFVSKEFYENGPN